jgi:excisionase family DNA binding protein
MSATLLNATASLADKLVAELQATAPLLVSLSTAERVTGIKVRTLRRLVAKQIIRVVRPGNGHPRIPRCELERLIREGLEF